MATHVLNFLSPALRNASGVSDAQPLIRLQHLTLYVVVTALTGVGAELTVSFEDSTDGTNFALVREFPAKITAQGTYRLELSNLVGTSGRVRYTLSALSTFTFNATLSANPL